MFDHVSIGVRDLARSRRFYDAALRPLGYVCLMENADALGYGREKVALWIGRAEQPGDPTWDQASTSALARPLVRQSMRSMSLPSTLAAPTMGRPVCARTMARITTPPSWSTPTGIASRRISAVRRRGGIQMPLRWRWCTPRPADGCSACHLNWNGVQAPGVEDLPDTVRQPTTST